MLLKFDEELFTKIGFLIITSVIIIKTAKQTKIKTLEVDRERLVAGPFEIVRNCKRYGLTSREIEVTGLLCQRFRHKDIAEKLFLSVRTVNKHVENIYAKTAVTTRSDLINRIFNKS